MAAAQDKQWDVVAARQAELYARAVVAGPLPPTRAGSASRAAARQEFGAPAVTGDGQQRPFAVPVLRDQPRVGRAIGALADLTRR
jgi:hypothetical protein